MSYIPRVGQCYTLIPKLASPSLPDHFLEENQGVKCKVTQVENDQVTITFRFKTTFCGGTTFTLDIPDFIKSIDPSCLKPPKFSSAQKKAILAKQLEISQQGMLYGWLLLDIMLMYWLLSHPHHVMNPFFLPLTLIDSWDTYSTNIYSM